MRTFSQIYWMSHFWDSQEPKNVVNFTSYLHESWCFSSPQPRVARPPSETQPLCDGMKSFLAARWARITGPTVSVRNRLFLFLGLMIYIYLYMTIYIYMYVLYMCIWNQLQNSPNWHRKSKLLEWRGEKLVHLWSRTPGQLGLSPNRATNTLLPLSYHQFP